MNICFTSTFEGTFDDFNNMMTEIHDKFPGITDGTTESAELPYDKEGWCKVVTIDMASNLEDQIVDGLSDYHQSGNWSNTQLEKNSIAREETFSPLKTVGTMAIG